MTEQFQGAKPCTSCKKYERVNGKHTCNKAKQLTETARITLVDCHEEGK